MLNPIIGKPAMTKREERCCAERSTLRVPNADDVRTIQGLQDPRILFLLCQTFIP